MATLISLLTRVKRKLRKSRKLPVWRLEGGIRQSGTPLKVTYIGQSKHKEYFKRMVFDGTPRETQEGLVHINRVQTAWERMSKEVNLIVIQMEQSQESLSKQGFFSIPCWIEVIRTVSEDEKQLPRSKNLKEDLRKIRKYGHTYEVVTDRGSFEDFYKNMYLPYTVMRYDKEAVPVTLKKMMEEWPNCELLKVKRNDETVAGLVILYGKNDARSWKIGVRDGKQHFAKQGAVAAAYFFEAKYLAKKGWKEVNMGGTRSFLQDGQYLFKKKWGIRLGRPWGQRFYIKPILPTRGLEEFFLNNPFLHLIDESYQGVAFVPDADQLEQQQLDRLVRDYWVDGMDKLEVYSLKGDFGSTGLQPPRKGVKLLCADQLWE